MVQRCRLSWRQVVEHAALTGRLILLCELAGAGKTTFAKQRPDPEELALFDEPTWGG